MRLTIANKNYSSWSLRPWVLLRERGIAFQEVLLPFAAAQGHAPAFRAISPTGKVPVLDDGPIRVWDSLAIAEYLAERDPGVWPTDRSARAWARSAAAEMHSGFAGLRSQCSMSCGVRVRLTVRPEADLARVDSLWSEGLRRFGGPFLAGAAFTAVDAFFTPVAFRLQTYGIELGAESNAYSQRLLDRPAMREWYAAALAETTRDVEHDADVEQAGEVIADFRAKPA